MVDNFGQKASMTAANTLAEASKYGAQDKQVTSRCCAHHMSESKHLPTSETQDVLTQEIRGSMFITLANSIFASKIIKVVFIYRDDLAEQKITGSTHL